MLDQSKSAIEQNYFGNAPDFLKAFLAARAIFIDPVLGRNLDEIGESDAIKYLTPSWIYLRDQRIENIALRNALSAIEDDLLYMHVIRECLYALHYSETALPTSENRSANLLMVGVIQSAHKSAWDVQTIDGVVEYYRGLYPDEARQKKNWLRMVDRIVDVSRRVERDPSGFRAEIWRNSMAMPATTEELQALIRKDCDKTAALAEKARLSIQSRPVPTPVSFFLGATFSQKTEDPSPK